MNNNSPRTPLANQDCSVRQESHNAAHYDIITSKSKDGASSCLLSSEQSKSVDFISSQYELNHGTAKSVKAKLNGLDHRCNELRLAIDEMQAYDYQYNIKIFGFHP